MRSLDPSRAMYKRESAFAVATAAYAMRWQVPRCRLIVNGSANCEL